MFKGFSSVSEKKVCNTRYAPECSKKVLKELRLLDSGQERASA